MKPGHFFARKAEDKGALSWEVYKLVSVKPIRVTQRICIVTSGGRKMARHIAAELNASDITWGSIAKRIGWRVP